jgi:hypothetical protein
MSRRARSSLAAAVLAAVLMGLRAAPQHAVGPLQPYTNAWTMTFHGDDGTVSPPQLWEDSMDTITWNGRPAMQRVQIEHRLVPVGGYQRTANVFDARTLAPYMTEVRQRNGMFVRREYDGLRVREIRSVRSSAGVDSAMREYTVSAPFIDFYGGMYATVLAARPLTAGLQGTFPALLAPDTIVQVPFSVLTRDTVRGVGGALTSAFKVDVGISSGPGAGSGTFTAWVIDKPPYVLRLTTKQGKPPGYWSWDETP